MRLRACCAAALLMATSLPCAGQATPASPAATCDLPRSTPAAEGVPQAAVDSLLAEARATRSSAVVLLRNGRVIAEWYADGGPAPIQTMSATKSIVSMAIGRLFATGAIDSLDTPVMTWYPEWRQGRKQQVTLRMLLDHTSGIQNVPNAGAEIYPAPDAVRLALAAELSHEPGTFFAYNNKAVNLLAGIVEKAAGMPLEKYVHAELLQPLCIGKRDWYRDAAGTPHAMAGLELAPLELARLGELMRLGGAWQGRRILDEEWVRTSTSVSQPFTPRSGLLWWLTHEWIRFRIDDELVTAWREAGVDARFIDAVAPMVGRMYDDADAFNTALDSIFGDGRGRDEWTRHTLERGVPGRRFETGALRAYNADGYLGQYVVVVPAAGIVAVRMKQGADGHLRDHNFGGFTDAVISLASRVQE
jgi:CubicO group peptidase (beta-lactamase class C family)